MILPESKAVTWQCVVTCQTDIGLKWVMPVAVLVAVRALGALIVPAAVGAGAALAVPAVAEGTGSANRGRGSGSGCW